MYQNDLPAKSEIFDYWKSRLSEHGIFIDWGEPGCWACGFHYGDKYDIRNSNAGRDAIFRCWDRIPLQRCHIVPRSLGGSDSPDNLFLMCRECHDHAPNTPFPEIFFEWARAQSHFKRESEKLLAAMAWFGPGESNMTHGESVMRSGAFKDWVSGKFGIHRPQSNYATTSSRLTSATMVGLVVHYMRNIEDGANNSFKAGGFAAAQLQR